MPHRLQGDRTKSLFTGMLGSVTVAVARHPLLTLGLMLALAVGSVTGTVLHMGFKTERSDLIDPQASFQKRWLAYTESFGDSSDIVLVVEASKPTVIKQVLDQLGDRLAAEPDLFTNVLYKIEPGKLQAKGLQYLSPEQLTEGLDRLTEYQMLLRGQWQLLRLDRVFDEFGVQIAAEPDGSADPAIDPGRREAAFPVEGETIGARGEPPHPESSLAIAQARLFVESLDQFLADRNDFVPPWPDTLSIDRRMRDEAAQVRYALNDEGTLGFLKVRPARQRTDFEGPSRAIDGVRRIVAEVSRERPDVRIGVTGIPVLENDEMRRSQHDMGYATIASFCGVGLLLFLGFRGFRHPLLALIMLAVGMAWAFGFTTLAVGHLNILSVSFAAILIGLGIDFGIHYLARYLERRHQGSDLHAALEETSTSVGTGIVTAAVTTALAFFCATLTNFLGIAELGIIAAGGVLLCAAATFLVMPALIVLADRNVEPRELPTPFEGNALRRLIRRFPGLVVFGSAAVIVAIGSQALSFEHGKVKPRIRYDTNLLNLQADGLESVEVQQRVASKSTTSLLFAVSMSDTADDARRMRERFEALDTVDHVEELASRLPAFPAEDTQLLVQGYSAQLARLPEDITSPGSVDPSSVGRSLESLHAVARTRDDDDARAVAAAIDRFLDSLSALSFEQQLAFLSEYQLRMKASLLRQFQALAAAANSEPVTIDDLPAALTSRFVSPKGKWLLQIYPAESVWDDEPLERFVNDLRSVDPEVTGTPLQNYEASRQIRHSYERAALLAFAVIAVVLLVDFLDKRHKAVVLLLPLVAAALLYQNVPWIAAQGPVAVAMIYTGLATLLGAALDARDLRDAALAMLPPVAGGVLMFGVLAAWKVDLNPANLIVLPLVLGIGVDNGVHVVHDFRLRRGAYRISPSTVNAMVLTSGTSMIGFGSMMLAAHRGLYSVGLVLVVGVGSCLFVSLVMLPAILTLIGGRPRHGAERSHSRPESALRSARVLDDRPVRVG
ncbi:MAG: MMPL family transporter [Planctomycetaceae bacterium]